GRATSIEATPLRYALSKLRAGLASYPCATPRMAPGPSGSRRKNLMPSSSTPPGRRRHFPFRLPAVLSLHVERPRVGGLGFVGGADRQLALTLPWHLIDLGPGVDLQPIELPSPVPLDQPVVARADTEDEVGVVVGVPLDDLEEAPHPRAFGQRVHDEVIHHVLA